MPRLYHDLTAIYRNSFLDSDLLHFGLVLHNSEWSEKLRFAILRIVSSATLSSIVGHYGYI